MRVLVVGSIVADTIEAADGTLTESLGGIAHSVSALAALAGGEADIVPLCRVGEDQRDRVEEWAGALAGVSLEAVRWMKEANPRVHLSYPAARREGERVERLRGSAAPLGVADCEAARGADAIIVNFITGSDCRAEAVARLRRATPRLYVDVHSLALGTAADGARFYRCRDDWETWLGGADVVQSNVYEAATVCGLDAETASAEPVAATLAERLAADADLAPPQWLLTCAERGCVLFERCDEGVRATPFPAAATSLVDPTGAGDAFGAGYVWAWLRGRSPATAARAAVRSGTAACACAGVPMGAAFQEGLRRHREGNEEEPSRR